jgi:hypothetical protein
MNKKEIPKVELFRQTEENHPYPWMFRIHWKGETWNFAGTPNQCATKREAAMRAWWRVRWMLSGEFEKRYK